MCVCVVLIIVVHCLVFSFVSFLLFSFSGVKHVTSVSGRIVFI